ncbi:bicaudal-D-related protein 2-like [Kryptolebias marmoratus]|uniref:bicaudal-D-related protein 2-like n=1 Tax=Kryptolebias marmoratus TaxID=37003 RepID=UPI0007F895D9|nr:bicaudal-D-related protein 2-like [Kryptolebias marmoratus]
MDYRSFSELNEKLRPRFSPSDRLSSSLSRLESRKWNSPMRPTILLTEPKESVSIAEPESPQKPEELDEMVCDGRQGENSGDLMLFTSAYPFGDLSLKDLDSEELNNDTSSTTQSEETDSTGDLVSEGVRDSSEAEGGVGESSLQRQYADKTLPDLIKSGRPLCRRRTVGHVSETLKEVRREVELSRRRSIKLKAQVDKLQEHRDRLGWSKHRESVTEEILSVVRLLHPLVEPEPSHHEPGHDEDRLDAALSQLQTVARKLAISHTKQDSKSGINGTEDSAVLQQALKDRDEAIEKKQAMEDEVLRSKTEMMMLNNQLLEAAQKRLELSLELEAWKEDFQLLLQQQVQSQQQAEQAQKKPSRLGLLRRNNKPMQRPANFPLPVPTPPTTNTNQIFMTGTATLPRQSAPNATSPTSSKSPWNLKFKKGKNSRVPDQDAAELDSKFGNDGFQVVSLD